MKAERVGFWIGYIGAMAVMACFVPVIVILLMAFIVMPTLGVMNSGGN